MLFETNQISFTNPNEVYVLQLDEYIRMTFDTVVLTIRPKILHSQPLRCLNGQLPVVDDLNLTIGSMQVDNQMFTKRCYDFPLVLKAQSQTSGIKEFDSKLPPFNQPDYIMDEVRDKSILKIFLTFDCNTKNKVLTSVAVKLKPVNVFVEDVFFAKMSDVLKGLIEEDTTEHTDEKLRCVKEVLMTSSNLANPLWLERLTIDPLQILVSVHASVKAYVGLDQSPLSFGSYHHENVLVTNFALGNFLDVDNTCMLTNLNFPFRLIYCKTLHFWNIVPSRMGRWQFRNDW